MRRVARWIAFRGGLACAIAALTLASAAGVARADQAVTTLQTQADDSQRPWAKGVPLVKQEAARALFIEGNSLLKDSVFRSAAQKYEEALMLWDHPGIHFNLALTLVSLEKPVEAYEHFKKAIAFGAVPIEQERLERAKSYLSLLEQQVATVKISCDEPGAVVWVNGARLFTAPGRVELKVKIGDNLFSATKPGFERTDLSKMLKPKEVLELPLKLYHSEDLVIYKRKFAAWVPWTFLATGALAVGGGAALSVASQNAYQKFDQSIANGGCAPGTVQCDPVLDEDGLKSKADTLRTLSFVSYGVGGALVASSVVLLIVNRPVEERTTPEQLNRGVAVLPWADPHGLGLGASGRF